MRLNLRVTPLKGTEKNETEESNMLVDISQEPLRLRYEVHSGFTSFLRHETDQTQEFGNLKNPCCVVDDKHCYLIQSKRTCSFAKNM